MKQHPRIINEKQVFQCACNLTLRLLDRDRRFNCIYTSKDINRTLLFTATNEMYLEEGAYEIRTLTKNATPSPDVVFNALTPINAREWVVRFTQINDKLIQKAEKNGWLDGVLKLAVDTTFNPWFGNEKPEWVIGIKQFRGTNYGYGFVTVEVVRAGQRFTLGVLPINQFFSKEKGAKELLLTFMIIPQ